MKNDNVLISTSMLTAIWEENQFDSIDLTSQFIKYIISRKFNIGQEIDKTVVLKTLSVDFAFVKFPPNVLEEILYRLSRKKIAMLSVKNHIYYLDKDMSEFASDFEKRKKTAKIQSESTIRELEKFLNEKKPQLKATPDLCKKYLIGFFEKKGLAAINNVELLNSITSYNDQENFLIARFIIDNYDKQTSIYNDIKDIAYGFMLTKAIYIENLDDFTSSRYRNLTVYFDTSFLLYALGYKTEYQHNAAKSLLDMLEENQATLCCFEHNFEEVRDILNAYKYRRNHALPSYNNTLEYFDENEYSDAGLERVIEGLEDNLAKIHISVVPTPKYEYNDKMQEQEREKYIDWKGLKDHLISKIGGYSKDNDRMVDNDMASINSISLLRRGDKFSTIENCVALFVTTNLDLIRETNSFLEEKPFVKKVPLLISDVELTMKTWIKYSFFNDKIPQSVLIENARAALEPTPEIIKKFEKTLAEIEGENGITKDTAAALRINNFIHRKVMLESSGDPEAVTKEVVQNMENLLKQRVSGEIHSQNVKLKFDNEQLADKNKETLKVIYQQCKDNASAKVEQTIKRRKIRNTFILVLVFLICAIILALNSFNIVWNNNAWISIGAGVIAIASLALTFFEYFKKDNKQIQKNKGELYENFYSEEIIKQEEIINALSK